MRWVLVGEVTERGLPVAAPIADGIFADGFATGLWVRAFSVANWVTAHSFAFRATSFLAVLDGASDFAFWSVALDHALRAAQFLQIRHPAQNAKEEVSLNARRWLENYSRGKQYSTPGNVLNILVVRKQARTLGCRLGCRTSTDILGGNHPKAQQQLP